MMGRIAPRGARGNEAPGPAPGARSHRKAEEAEAIADLAAYHAHRQEVLATHELPPLRFLRRAVASHCRRAELVARDRAARLQAGASGERSSRSGA